MLHALGGVFLNSRLVGGPALLRLREGGRKRKQENKGGPGAQPSESVPIEKKIQILTAKVHELGSKPKSREWIFRDVLTSAREAQKR